MLFIFGSLQESDAYIDLSFKKPWLVESYVKFIYKL